MGEEITAFSIACGMEKIYEDFTASIKELGGRHGKGKMGTSVLHWITGSHVKTQRDVLCDKFLQDVQGQLQNFEYAIEGADAKDISDACDKLAQIMSGPWPANSNSTTDLMKRAMISQLKPYLKYVSGDTLNLVKDNMENGYTRYQRLPVEKEILKDIDKLLA